MKALTQTSVAHTSTLSVMVNWAYLQAYQLIALLVKPCCCRVQSVILSKHCFGDRFFCCKLATTSWRECMSLHWQQLHSEEDLNFFYIYGETGFLNLCVAAQSNKVPLR